MSAQAVNTARGAELSVNTERRRPGEVSIGLCGSHRPGFAWVPAGEARRFAMALLAAARDAEDLASGTIGGES